MLPPFLEVDERCDGGVYCGLAVLAGGVEVRAVVEE